MAQIDYSKVLTGEQLLYYSGLIKTALAGKQDALVFNDTYDERDNPVATMNDINRKQDELTFNSTYDGRENPVATMNDIPDVSGFQTATQVQTAINSAIGNISSFSFEVVSQLPQTGNSSKIYLVEKTNTGTNQVYTEYVYVNNAWEIIGDTQMSITALDNNEVASIWNEASAV